MTVQIEHDPIEYGFFWEALRQLQNGVIVSRQCWPAGQYVSPDSLAGAGDIFTMNYKNGDSIPYIPSQRDLYATDWTEADHKQVGMTEEECEQAAAELEQLLAAEEEATT